MSKKTARGLKNLHIAIFISLAVFTLIFLAIASIFKLNQSTQSKILDSKSANQNQQPNLTKSNCIADDCLMINDLNYPVEKLPQDVQKALNSAIDDEYKAWNTYQAVIDKFGSTRPFSMIIRAEEQHIASLKSIFDKYGLTIPANTWGPQVTAPESIQSACQTGVDAEIANVKLYQNQLLPVVKDYEDITLVFTKLMNASQQKHLPAFERCN